MAFNADTTETFHDDFKAVVTAIFDQSRDDYIKLQHPSYRREKYLFEDFLNSVAMFFDPSFEFEHLVDEDGQQMNLRSMVDVLLDGYGRKYKSVQDYLIKASKDFWENKKMAVVDSPSTIQIDGHVYFVEHSDSARDDEVDGYSIDLENKVINLNRNTDDSVNQELFVQALIQLIFHHEEINISREKLRAIGRALFRLLKMNDCFTGSGYSAPTPVAVSISEHE
jgi:hypothetical protein